MISKRFSCTTATFGGPLATRLSAIKAAGFPATEFWPRDLFEGFADADSAIATLRESGLAVSCFQGLRDYEAMPSAIRDRKLALADHLMDQMAMVGSDLLVLASNTTTQSSRNWSQAVDDLRRLGDLGKSRNVRIGYEALCYSPWIGDYRKAWELVRDVDHSHVGLVLDSAHVFLLDLPLEPIDEIPADRIFLVELADLPMTNLSIREIVRYYRLFPGEGTRAMADFVRRVARTGYTGYYSVEIFSSHYEAMEPKLVAQRAFDSMSRLFSTITAG
jgi:4-hydroxyphenylpyruvate dioxygenase